MNDFIAREKEAIYQTYGRLPIQIEKGDGVYLYDELGNIYIDFISGIGVNALGHSNPKIKKAISNQIDKYMHSSNYFYQRPQIKLAEKIKELTGLDKVFFCNSGTEATEGAIKLLRKYGNENGRKGILAFPNGFHGRTNGSLSLMEQPKYRENMAPFLEETFVFHGNANDLVSGKYDNLAGIVIETIQGEGGIYEFPKELYEAINKLQTECGVPIVADEIQAGLGRTGTMFSYTQFGLNPDLVLSAKALGGGLPLGAIIVGKKLSSVFTQGNHGTTFGGNAVACAAGLVVINELENGVLKNSEKLGKYFKEKLAILKQNHSKTVLELRGRGLFLGLKLNTEPSEVRDKLIEKKILTCTASNKVLRILPPLNVTEEIIDTFIEKLAEVLDEK